MKSKPFFIIVKGLSLRQIKQFFMEGESPTLNVRTYTIIFLGKRMVHCFFLPANLRSDLLMIIQNKHDNYVDGFLGNTSNRFLKIKVTYKHKESS